MACDAEGRAVTGEQEEPLAKTDGACDGQAEETKSDAPGLNPEETAMILTSLSKGFSSTAQSSTPDSDGEDMGDSDEEEEASHRRQASSIGVGKVHRVQQINFDGPKGSKLDFTDDAASVIASGMRAIASKVWLPSTSPSKSFVPISTDPLSTWQKILVSASHS
ncbi:Radial spoke head 10 B2 [Phytophthora nicotianae]|uniref:Radial spoke head 10 B2 n=1 Tax=Phytophthora nicotianae TaxID=4792 RepID=A0A0W8CN22_PHYNI|nr:Radial spoke head 10 B2 [Phytophthora nicotianae]